MSGGYENEHVDLTEGSRVGTVLVLIFAYDGVRLHVGSASDLTVGVAGYSVEVGIVGPELLSHVPMSAGLYIEGNEVDYDALTIAVPDADYTVSHL